MYVMSISLIDADYVYIALLGACYVYIIVCCAVTRYGCSKQMQKADPTYGVGINPISRLIQIQQAEKKKEPVYSLLAERGLPRRREFVMQVRDCTSLFTTGWIVTTVGLNPNGDVTFFLQARKLFS